jgi:hypothetical protein
MASRSVADYRVWARAVWRKLEKLIIRWYFGASRTNLGYCTAEVDRPFDGFLCKADEDFVKINQIYFVYTGEETENIWR